MERDDKANALLRAARELGDQLAGHWRQDGHQVVAVTRDPTQAAANLTHAAPGIDFTVIELRHSLAELDRLHDEIVGTAQLLDAPLASVGTDERLNLVEAMLTDLHAAASCELQQRFAGQPIAWVEGTVVARIAPVELSPPDSGSVSN